MLKQLIQRLLDSRTTPAQAGHNAMPVNIAEAIDIFLAVGSEGSYTAPADGYLSAMVEPGGNMNFWGQILPISSFPIQNVQGKLFVPMAKGMEVRYFINGTVSLSKFLKTIGGGYNSFVRRALSCLRPSFNFLPKNSLLAEATGFLTNPIQLLKRRISHLQRQENGFLSSLLATGGSASKGLPRKFCLATGRFGRGAIQQRHLIKAFVSLSQKAGLWPTYYRQTPRAHTSSLLRVLVINNLQTGGALCRKTF